MWLDRDHFEDDAVAKAFGNLLRSPGATLNDLALSIDGYNLELELL